MNKRKIGLPEHLELMSLPLNEAVEVVAATLSLSEKEMYLVNAIAKYDMALKEALQFINKKSIEDFYWEKLPYRDEQGIERPGIMKNIFRLREEAKEAAKKIKEIMDTPIKEIQ